MKNNVVMLGAVVIALLVGLYAGYAYEKNKFVGLMENQRVDLQRQIDEAKRTTVNIQPTSTASDVTMKSKDGDYQTDASGMSLYTFDKDTKGTSNCTGTCLTNWPPYLVKGDVPSSLPNYVGTMKRSDDSIQFTWNDKPLYYYSGDKKAGDVKGDGVGETWHLAK